MGTPIHAAQCMQISPTKCKSQTGARQIAQRVLVKFPHLLIRGRIAHFSCPPPPKTKSRASSISLTKSPYSAVLIRSTSWTTNCIAKHVQCLDASSIIKVRCPTTSAISFCRKKAYILSTTPTSSHESRKPIVLISFILSHFALIIIIVPTICTLCRVTGAYHARTTI